ncbi:alkaline phosphatase D family protein [Crossiella cryophila]|uniref:Alkaline phosphatase D n=1 Tax=Crossiella cryophila TaxID=43355 RepID=A0A7W7CAJ9_9PSEU|nr:alkaline phosphatase D family protein [Crossiella cryophila]MBB4676308.1 alkaline phosphatase D [Crossiella cryophila]
MPETPALNRRSLLRYGAAGAGAIATGLLLPTTAAASTTASAAPLIPSTRPKLSHGIQFGEVDADSAVVWARADRPSRLLVEVARDENFRHARKFWGPVLTPETDGTGELRVAGLTAGRDYHVRVTTHELHGRTGSEPVLGSFHTAPRGRQDVNFLWSGDIVGQGWGINPDLGGMTIYSRMAALRPDFFLCSGDTVYADGPLSETVLLPDGRTWRNLVTPAKTKVAETLDEYRGQFAYNLLDEHVRRFNASVPQLNQWDDHEVTNNWYPGEILDDARYTEKRVDVLAERAFQAFHEWLPVRKADAVDGRVYRKVSYGPHLDVFVLDMRTYKGPNTPGTAPFEPILGAAQTRWLTRELDRSRATWKIIAADLPIGLIVPDGANIEGVANGQPGAPAGREAELAIVLREIQRRRVRNVVWLTADVHYTAAHHYAPERAAFTEFSPFWEFVSGPLHAGAFGPNKLDPTFGPRAVFVNAPPAPNTSPMAGFQHFGQVKIDGPSGRLTVHLRDQDARSLWSTTLEPERR